jgi:predicted kinase
MTWIRVKQTLKTINKTNMPTVYILSGIPTSGKSTWAQNYAQVRFYQTYDAVRIISRDEIRMRNFDLKKYDDYKFNAISEGQVSRYFNEYLEKAIKGRHDIVIDNTNCKEEYIDDFIKKFEGLTKFQDIKYDIKVIFFDIPLWKAWLRNKIRSKKENKTIPWKALKQMQKNFKKINREKYEYYRETRRVYL